MSKTYNYRDPHAARAPRPAVVVVRYVVRPGCAFPAIGDAVLVTGVFGDLCRVIVQHVADMRWTREGAVAMELRGPRELVRSAACSAACERAESEVA